jgi:pyrophosphatase PpaX
MSCATTFLLDLDGTLVDSVALDRACFAHAFVSVGREPPPDDVFLAGLGIPLAEALGRLARNDAETRGLVAAYLAFSGEHHARFVRAYDGIPAALSALRTRGARLAVVTSKSRPAAERDLRSTGLTQFIELVLGPCDVERPKPDPFPFLHALDRLGVAAAEAVVVGDSPHDMRAGRAGGLRTAAALWGPFARGLLEPHAPDHWLTQPTQLLDL